MLKINFNKFSSFFNTTRILKKWKYMASENILHERKMYVVVKQSYRLFSCARIFVKCTISRIKNFQIHVARVFFFEYWWIYCYTLRCVSVSEKNVQERLKWKVILKTRLYLMLRKQNGFLSWVKGYEKSGN